MTDENRFDLTVAGAQNAPQDTLITNVALYVSISEADCNPAGSISIVGTPGQPAPRSRWRMCAFVDVHAENPVRQQMGPASSRTVQLQQLLAKSVFFWTASPLSR